MANPIRTPEAAFDDAICTCEDAVLLLSRAEGHLRAARCFWIHGVICLAASAAGVIAIGLSL